ncbi:DUF3040 domain-containing protein [Nocardioides yefusunii]|uniref:DUF3040 domain-containing protein n=1 Tax=Nocardioides yefusunii TaxID=2500546 RepID=A0ABW1QWG9_9ACTN|nr:DUF3040 domain-containing protein [Nocardioides yefusunii]
MPLSEEELRVLAQMERALVEEDPKLASTLRGTPFRRAARRRALIAAAAFVVGVVLLMTGAIAAQWLVGILGFVVMLGSAMFGVTALRAPSTPAEPTPFSAPAAGNAAGFSVIDGGRRGRPAGRQRQGRSPRQGGQSHSSFMDRMEERWRRRRDGY